MFNKGTVKTKAHIFLFLYNRAIAKIFYLVSNLYVTIFMARDFQIQLYSDSKRFCYEQTKSACLTVIFLYLPFISIKCIYIIVKSLKISPGHCSLFKYYSCARAKYCDKSIELRVVQ